MNERIPRLANWIETRFNVKAPTSRTDSLETSFLCLRDKLPLSIKINAAQNSVQVGDALGMQGEDDVATSCDKLTASLHFEHAGPDLH